MKKILLCGFAALAMPMPAAASCGASFCSVNTSWDMQGAWQQPGLRFDLRYEYIKQDQPMAGSDKIAFGEISRHHDEIETRNHNWLASLDYTVNDDWGVSATLPVVRREHSHIHNHQGAQIFDAWKFTRLGDARILARRRLASTGHGAFGANIGAKLPTGQTDVRNSGGDLAERSLQPGSGTTDLLAGAYYTGMFHESGLSWFLQGLLQLPLGFHEQYRPGRRISIDSGMRYEAGDKLSLLLQANALYRARDRGAEAESGDSGGTAVYLSPGLSYAFTRNLQAYGFVQLPVYQYVNGVQITADRALTLGVSSRF
jgi:hypothetical protein